MTPILNSLCFNGTGSIIFIKRDTIHPSSDCSSFPRRSSLNMQLRSVFLIGASLIFMATDGWCVKILLQRIMLDMNWKLKKVNSDMILFHQRNFRDWLRILNILSCLRLKITNHLKKKCKQINYSQLIIYINVKKIHRDYFVVASESTKW